MNELGKKGEELAISHLRGQGFTILKTNWRYGHKEIDIIAQKGKTIHFVEVKARSSRFIDEPKQAVILRKQRNIIGAAEWYMRLNENDCEGCFDIVSIIFYSNDMYVLEHIENAFEPTF